MHHLHAYHRLTFRLSHNAGGDIGAAIALSGVPRTSVFLVTKVGDNYPLGYDEVTSQFNAALIAMNVTYVDSAFIHWPQNKAKSSDPACNANGGLGNSTCRINSWRALVDIFHQGKARSIGVSNYNSSELQEIVDAGMILPVSVGPCTSAGPIAAQRAQSNQHWPLIPTTNPARL